MIADADLAIVTTASSTESGCDPVIDCMPLAGALQTVRDPGQAILNKVQDVHLKEHGSMCDNFSRFRLTANSRSKTKDIFTFILQTASILLLS